MDHAPGPLIARLASFAVRRAVFVVLAWLGLAIALNLAIPQLESVVAKDSTPILPADSPSAVALHRMDSDFGNGRSTSFIFVVAERPSGLTAADRAWMRGLVPRLQKDADNVTFVQDVATRPDLLKALTSTDAKAAYLQVGLPGATGAPTAIQQIESVRDIVDADRPAGLNAAVSGPAATIADMEVAVEKSILLITVATVALIALLLMVIYRSIVVTGLILGSIGLALGVARAVSAWMGLHVFAVSTFTGSFLTAVVLGASTDYAVFLVSRYHELRRNGVDTDTAVREAAGRVSGVIIGSALTVVVANAAMLVCHVGIYKTTGPAIAVSIVTTLAMALTFTPALVTLAARRGLIEPKPVSAARAGRWPAIAAYVSTRPARVLALGLIPLLALAALYPFLQLSFDERGVQPDDTDSNKGYALLAQHFPLNEVLPDYVLVHSSHDLRDARSLAALEHAARAIEQTPGVTSVRGITRPLGTPIKEASVGYVAGVVGDRLGSAEDKLADKSGGVADLRNGSARLEAGATRLSDGANRVADGSGQAVTGSGRLLDGAEQLRAGLERLAAGSGDAATGSQQLRAGATRLADELEAGQARAQYAVDGLGKAYTALKSSVGCSLDPICARARTGVRQVWEGERDELIPGMRDAAAGARRIADGSIDLADGLAQIDAGLQRARGGATDLADGGRLLHSRLGDLATGADQVADGADKVAAGTGRVAGGTDQMATSLQELQSGLTRASTALKEAGAASKDPAIGGFYLPSANLADPRLATANGLFLSADGHTARLVVLGATDTFKHAASERAGTIAGTANNALRGTALDGADVEVTGLATINSDLDTISTHEFYLVAGLALLAVLLILIVLLRSLLAPLFLLAAVCLSYAAAMGLGVLVWQLLLGRPLDWSVPAIAFILLVAVGADYNLLLMKRMLEDSPDGSPAGIARAVAATGGVITSAGLLFAASMFAMMSGSVLTLAQIGFTIGMGLLLDTFVVRTLVIPSVATLLGPRIWWPRRPA